MIGYPQGIARALTAEVSVLLYNVEVKNDIGATPSTTNSVGLDNNHRSRRRGKVFSTQSSLFFVVPIGSKK